MKFVNSSNKDIKKNDFQDFSVIDILHENYELTLINSFLNDKNLKKTLDEEIESIQKFSQV